MSPPCGIIKYLTSLQELQISLAGEADKSKGQFVKDLANLCELRVLKVFIVSMDERLRLDLLESLGNLHKLQHLELQHGYIELPSFIDDLSILQNLSSLHLDVRGLGDQGLQILDEMPNLCYLELHDSNGRATITGTANQGYFKKLRSRRLKRSMIQFVVNEDSGVSFTMWDSKISDNYPAAIDSKMKQDSSTRARTVMPNLEALSFQVVGSIMACNNGSLDNLGLECLASLQKVTVSLYPGGAPGDVVQNQKAALRHAIQDHPNRPTLQFKYESHYYEVANQVMMI
ncbi:hypothetical protein BS78_05G255000 [Paspalum vaginatum]|nr:hypothetical protein BS78_05G255000 [Paspalum vaginatum]